MEFRIHLLRENDKSPWSWEEELCEILKAIENGVITRGSKWEEDAQIVFTDASAEGFLREILSSRSRRKKAVIGVSSESQELPEVFLDGTLDDLVALPLRAVDVWSRMIHYQKVFLTDQEWDEVVRVSESVSGLVDQFREDLKIAERLQKESWSRAIRAERSKIRGFDLKSRYIAGLKSGGDYFDLGEGKHQVSLVLTDASTYGLSSAVLSTLVRVIVKLSAEQVRSSYQTVKKIYSDLVCTMGERDSLSMFYGVINRRDLVLRYLNIGTAEAFHAREGKGFRCLPSQFEALSRNVGLKSGSDKKLQLKPKDRLVLLSDGFLDRLGGPRAGEEFLNEMPRDVGAQDLLNELSYRVKSDLPEHSDEDVFLPPQDCTAIVLEVKPQLYQVAKAS